MGAYNGRGEPTSTYSGVIRSKSTDLIPVLPSTAYYFYSGSDAGSGGIDIHYIDANKNEIRYVSLANHGGVFTTDSNCAYIKFHCGIGETYPNNICINLSDTSFNGQYVPYKKSVDVLNLDNIKVYSPNIWDEEWEVGTYTDQGVPASSSDQIRSKNFIPILPSTAYYFNNLFSQYVQVLYYDANKNFISYADGVSNAPFSLTTPSNAAYIRWRTNSGVTSYTAGQFCINKSDAAFNGRYFPHGILTITGGLKGAGNVYDEIVGTKLYRRVGRVDLGTLDWGVSYDEWCRTSLISDKKSQVGNSNGFSSRYPVNGATSWSTEEFPYNTISLGSETYGVVFHNDGATTSEAVTALMQGVMLDYELANVEVYDLAEPLILTMAAGTTESRVSPNAYGLSAPFCCDMTYSASENNDSASSQYSLVAGKLLNKHKIWGQDFDGTGDVAGSLTGVTTLTASGAITAGSFVKSSGTSSQFLKADGSVDGTAYLPLSGGTLTASTGETPLTIKSSDNSGAYINFRKSNGDSFGQIGIITSGPVFYNGSADKTIWHAGNSNLNTVDWTAKTLTLAGSISGATTISASGNITTSARLISTVATGTQPLGITSTTKVDNLNADKLDDYEALDFVSSIQSLWSQIDSLSTKDDFDELFATSFYADTIAASTSHLGLVSITGNTTIGGTLGVTGNTTLSGTLTVGASNAKKATTLYGALTVSDGVTLSSTLSVASTSTLTGMRM